MNKFLAKTFHEIMVYNRSYNMIVYNIQFLLLSLLCLFFVYPKGQDLSTLGSVFLIAGLPISIIATSKPVIKQDLEDGSLELYLLTTNISQIILAKFCALLTCNLISFLSTLVIIAVLYSLSLNQIIFLLSSSLLLIQISALSLLISCVEGYFRSNVNFISSIIMPLILPSLIISGLMLQGSLSYNSSVLALLGINLITAPLSLIFSGYLIKNIYNI